MKHIFLLAMVSVFALTGCASRLTGGVDVLNQRIAYLGLDDTKCWNPNDPASAVSCDLKVRAGMKIRLDSITIPSERGSVEQQTLPSSYTYTVPNVDGALADGLALGRESAFFMTTLLSMSEQVKDNPPAWQLMYGDNGDAYENRVKAASGTYAADILKPFLENMCVRYRFLEGDADFRNTARQAKRVFCSAEKSDQNLAPNLVSRTLLVKPIKDDERKMAIGSDDWFYARKVGTIAEQRRSEFMMPSKDRKPTRARTNIELSIAVRFSNEEGVRYVPPCTTVADLEHMFGIEIIGLWRDQSNLVVKGNEGDVTAGGLITLGWNNKSTVNPDGYYSIELRPGATAAPGGTLVDGTGLCGKKNPCLEKVLLAHGDVLLVGRRKHALGSFWHQ